uniref:Uncharacterized protein n=1 Tax=Arion vulgaris TaxID=1028688 RepID=A0A0B7AS95_9EUPU
MEDEVNLMLGKFTSLSKMFWHPIHERWVNLIIVVSEIPFQQGLMCDVKM